MEDDDLAFDFDEAELFSAFRLVLPTEDARDQARQVSEALQPGSDWATSEEVLLLLAIGSVSGREKVQRIRRAEQESRYLLWAREQRETRGASVPFEDLRRDWESLKADEDRGWSERLEALRRSFQEQGKLPPEGEEG